MKKKKYGTIKNPLGILDKSLDKYHEIERSSEKTKMANEMLAKYGLPKIENKKKS
jgi:hypothetical protein